MYSGESHLFSESEEALSAIPWGEDVFLEDNETGCNTANTCGERGIKSAIAKQCHVRDTSGGEGARVVVRTCALK